MNRRGLLATDPHEHNTGSRLYLFLNEYYMKQYILRNKIMIAIRSVKQEVFYKKKENKSTTIETQIV